MTMTLFEAFATAPLIPLTGLGLAYLGLGFLRHTGPTWAIMIIHLGLIASLISWFAATWA